METGKAHVGRKTLWPPEITSLPKVVVPVSGVTGHCLRDGERQIVFFEIEEGTSFPDHSHCAQWGTVIAGELTLEVDGQAELYLPGDTYHIPEGARHRASFSKRTYLIDLFGAADRYPVQP